MKLLSVLTFTAFLIVLTSAQDVADNTGAEELPAVDDTGLDEAPQDIPPVEEPELEEAPEEVSAVEDSVLDEASQEEQEDEVDSIIEEASGEYKSVSHISVSAAKHDESVDIVEHEGENLVRVVKTKSNGVATEYYTVVNVDVKSSGDHEDSHSIYNEEVFENYFAGHLNDLD